MDQGKTLAGIGFGLGAYGIWGFFPLFFRQLGHVSPADVLCNRALWGCLFVALVLTARRGWGQLAAATRGPGNVLRLTVAALLAGARLSDKQRSKVAKRLSELTGLPRQVIHFYIQQGLLPEGTKTGRNMAYYSEHHLQTLKTIRALQEERFLPLKAIRAVLTDGEAAFTPPQRQLLSEVKQRLQTTLGAPAGPRATFINIGERTNVTGSAKFAKLILNDEFEVLGDLVLVDNFAHAHADFILAGELGGIHSGLDLL